ncbi:type I glyceraldehyde-3-phosphate dehydrogenase [Flavobacterium columnare NBRC 100251 = ATCC 23463]|uniref:Type I glyceraldehyde-3-phosphate dehydrogenase n=1 Tax=Flavobacterium columnare TaxID=996 RepID=A0AAI8GAE7_9FLAO|nr:type I glyceraldehyde-3-phosphate dehydrogenase [Flavobacterium columnare]PDS24270.1 type I glyceraldehyde-3-phosphate dehydrogenase [Flavobacterium columnare NBRC 100251 = ATCC 23463]MBF6652726.1 type I glyceraldehyde-3-phosphate dehydrogenase [Flavobacterium columnare]MBF6654582.1 type I glyceraldehyde-3-phosphate dehydrogenase [Flavobacterium columnare]MBF6659020.1 type I glyceraldehyde-3-phosphate dehydrogenase [Flavobacterium columnare]
MRIAINGFGRIGRNLFRLLLNHPQIDVVAINDIADNRTMAHLLKYDSIHGVLPFDVSYNEKSIIVEGREYIFFHEKEIKNLVWKDLNIDFVVESTGKFKTYESIYAHIKAGAQKVILSAPAEVDAIKTVVLGVNEDILDGSEVIISNASCTTNNAAPMIKVIQELCGIEQAYITTVHSFTTDQSLHDQPHKDLRRARGASQSIVPTTTGAAKALTKIFPDLEGKIGGCGIRVPVPDGSLTDITFNVKKEVSIEEINTTFLNASKNELKNILAYTEDPIVSVDILGNPHSCLFDAQLTSVIDKMVKVVGWYDNEIGYSSRIINLIEYIVKK